METQPLFDLPQLLSHIVGDMAWALCNHRDEPHLRQAARAQAAARSIEAFQPCDAVEAMIAGHCVMFHEVIVDSVQITLSGGLDATRRATRSSIVAMDKAFGANLVRLEKYRARHADSTAEVTPADARAETDVADRVRRHQPDTAFTAPLTEAAPMEPSTLADGGASEQGIIAPRHATAEAIPPLDDPHLPPSPRVLGVDGPREAYPATVTQMAGLNRQARRAFGRQSPKRIDPGAPPIANASFARHIQP